MVHVNLGLLLLLLREPYILEWGKVPIGNFVSDFINATFFTDFIARILANIVGYTLSHAWDGKIVK